MVRRFGVVLSLAAIGVAAATLPGAAGAKPAVAWQSQVPVANVVASVPFQAGGYAGYDPGATAPNPGGPDPF
jgi:hypothetical protein